MAQPSGNPIGPPYARCTHTVRMPAKTPLASDKIDAPTACAIPFHPYFGGVVTQTRNVSEYMLVLAVCLVLLVSSLSATTPSLPSDVCTSDLSLVVDYARIISETIVLCCNIAKSFVEYL